MEEELTQAPNPTQLSGLAGRPPSPSVRPQPKPEPPPSGQGPLLPSLPTSLDRRDGGWTTSPGPSSPATLDCTFRVRDALLFPPVTVTRTFLFFLRVVTRTFRFASQRNPVAVARKRGKDGGDVNERFGDGKFSLARERRCTERAEHVG